MAFWSLWLALIILFKVAQACLCCVGGDARGPREEQDEQRGAEEKGGGKVRQRLHPWGICNNHIIFTFDFIPLVLSLPSRCFQSIIICKLILPEFFCNPYPEGLEPGGGLARCLLPGFEGPQGLPACKKAAAHWGESFYLPACRHGGGKMVITMVVVETRFGF